MAESAALALRVTMMATYGPMRLLEAHYASQFVNGYCAATHGSRLDGLREWVISESASVANP